MIEFNHPKEQSYLRALAKTAEEIDADLIGFLGDCILNKNRFILLQPNKVILRYDPHKVSEPEFIRDLGEIISLIEILKKENLIFVHENPDIRKQAILESEDKIIGLSKGHSDRGIVKVENDTFLDYIIPTTLSDYIFSYIGSFCYVRPELIEYINNDFQTIEQKRFKKTLCWTRITAGISFLGLLVALILPIIMSKCSQ